MKNKFNAFAERRNEKLKTLILTEKNIAMAAEIIKNGGIVAMPTETVYGLAADALNGKAVAKIFKAKGRPMDNPLIVHISDIKQVNMLVSEFPEKAKKLAEKFWPGPLTIVLPKSDIIPDEVSAGLSTVAIRFPSHPIAHELIEKSSPIAAPSANLSGSPSPTTLRHVLADMDGRIEAIIDGGDCEVGVESTVITLADDVPTLLRPGGITLEQLREEIGEVRVHPAVLDSLKVGMTAASPGMKYKHYSPKAEVILLRGSEQGFCEYIKANSDDKTAVLCYDEEKDSFKNYIILGKRDDEAAHAHRLFTCLREADEDGYTRVYAHCPKPEGIGLAVYNRILRAAAFNIIDV